MASGRTILSLQAFAGIDFSTRSLLPSWLGFAVKTKGALKNGRVAYGKPIHQYYSGALKMAKKKKDDAVVEALSVLLASSYTLYLKTHNYHWNVTGPMFTTLHTLGGCRN